MACLSSDGPGKWRILFYGLDERRYTLRLGKCAKRDAEIVRSRVELLMAAQFLGTAPEADTVRWVASVSPKMRARLIRCRLIVGVEIPRAVKKQTLQNFLQQYIEQRKVGVKPATTLVWQITGDSLVKCFGRDFVLQTLNASHATQWLDFMRGDGLKPTTVYKRLQFAKQFLSHATSSKILPANPWQSVKLSKPKTNSNVEVPRSEIDRLMEHCDPQWRAVIALCRYGGLRCPSEVLSIRWEQIDWDKSVMTIPSPKTEHLAGGESRVCPLFPEVRSALQQIRKKSGYLIEMDEARAKANRATGWASANLRSVLLDRMKSAGVTPWPRLFHSMRATRQTELEQEFGLPAACAWLGNTTAIAKEHYLLVTSDTFQKATRKPAR